MKEIERERERDKMQREKNQSQHYVGKNQQHHMHYVPAVAGGDNVYKFVLDRSVKRSLQG
jgi:hypothetical protein